MIGADVKTAFATMIRELAFPVNHTEGSQEVYIERLMKLGCSRKEAAQAYVRVRESISEHRDSESHIDVFLEQLHSCSWFTTEGLHGVVQSKGGCLAGTSLADLVFTRVNTTAIKQIRKRLDKEGIKYKAPVIKIQWVLGLLPGKDFAQPENRLSDASFADDGMFAVFARPCEVVEKVRKAIKIINDVYLELGLELNYKSGKTEVLFFFTGEVPKRPRHAFIKKAMARFDFMICVAGHRIWVPLTSMLT